MIKLYNYTTGKQTPIYIIYYIYYIYYITILIELTLVLQSLTGGSEWLAKRGTASILIEYSTLSAWLVLNTTPPIQWETEIVLSSIKLCRALGQWHNLGKLCVFQGFLKKTWYTKGANWNRVCIFNGPVFESGIVNLDGNKQSWSGIIFFRGKNRFLNTPFFKKFSGSEWATDPRHSSTDAQYGFIDQHLGSKTIIFRDILKKRYCDLRAISWMLQFRPFCRPPM